MRDRTALIASAVAGVIGLALLVVESTRALGHASFSTLATILLYAGLGLIALAGILAVVAIYRPAQSVSDRSEAAGAIAPATADNSR